MHGIIIDLEAEEWFLTVNKEKRKMIRVKSLLILSLILSLQVSAKENIENKTTIPFIIYYDDISPSVELNNSSVPKMAVKYAEIPSEKLQKLIKNVRESICNTAGDADIKIWISSDADAKALGIGISGQSGIEVTFHCRELNKNDIKAY